MLYLDPKNVRLLPNLEKFIDANDPALGTRFVMNFEKNKLEIGSSLSVLYAAIMPTTEFQYRLERKHDSAFVGMSNLIPDEAGAYFVSSIECMTHTELLAKFLKELPWLSKYEMSDFMWHTTLLMPYTDWAIYN